MKKTLIALAVAGLSFNAMAYDFSAEKPETTISKYPKELSVAANTVIATATPEEISTKAGVALTTPYVRFDLTNATFAGIPTVAGWSLTAGGKDQNFVVFNKAAGNAVDDVVALSAVDGLKLATQGDVGVTYGIYETASGAINKTGVLLSKNGTVLKFVDSLEVAATPSANAKLIDLATGADGKIFDQGADAAAKKVSELSKVSVALVADLKQLDGADATPASLITSAQWVFTGDFTARGSVNGAALAAFTATDTKATSAVTPVADFAKLSDTISYTVGGTKAINGGVYGAELVITPASGYVFGSYKFDKAGELKKNGSSTEIDLALNPVGAYDNYVRVTNKGNAAGTVTFNVINDAGVSKQATLASVLGADKGSLAAGASTTQIHIKDIAEKAGFANVDGKLRLVIDTTIPKNGTDDMVAAQSYAANKTNGVLTLLK
ncbi:hypothetical protein [Aeromonas veronii]|uniref:hypothetical protein n=1 Tax=Aeromonas veronii TaxID=654 RepID=UPI00226D0BFC|nr:hypothetical protein [Aeromonas veronii]MCX9105528.1 hypothetical protein [Aeromonas veronii]MCX9121165.1 hypothetical protein [Aeromonas veronii]